MCVQVPRLYLAMALLHNSSIRDELVDQRDARKSTVLHHVCTGNHHRRRRHLHHDQEKNSDSLHLVRFLLSVGFSVNSEGHNGW